MEAQNSEKVIFLFGAGISIPIGIPAMEGTYREFINKKNTALTPVNRKTCEFFTKEMGISNDLEEFLLAANTLIEFKSSKLKRFVENNISKKPSATKVREFEKNLDSSIEEVRAIRIGILEFLSRKCFQFDREKALKINAGFVEIVSQLAHPVYSTNYDYAFEHVAIEKGLAIIDNFNKTGQRYLWNKEINFEGNGGLKLIKLHGSVTWYKDKSGSIEKIYSHTRINPQGKEVENIVIVPTRFKDIYSQHFFALYSHFLSSLAASKVIVIAGHSLRDDYLRAAIIERKRKGDFQIVVISPIYPTPIKSELAPARIASLGDVIHIPYKWEDFADELAYILKNNAYDQIAQKCIDVVRKQKYQKNKISLKGNLGPFISTQPKEILVEVKAYLKANEKPAFLRSWLEASWTEPDGTKQYKITADFVDKNPMLIVFGNDLTSLIDSSIKLQVVLPKIPKWMEPGCKVVFKVALLKSNVTKPTLARENNIIVVCEKVIDYRT